MDEQQAKQFIWDYYGVACSHWVNQREIELVMAAYASGQRAGVAHKTYEQNLAALTRPGGQIRTH